jgi:hypothetical protein
MIDFDALVLAPCEEVFARPITVTPLVSQPGEPAYGARGIWSSKPVQVALENGALLSTKDLTLGIRLAEFTVPVKAGDQIEIDAHLSLPRIGVCEIENTSDDGQGGRELALKIIAA